MALQFEHPDDIEPPRRYLDRYRRFSRFIITWLFRIIALLLLLFFWGVKPFLESDLFANWLQETVSNYIPGDISLDYWNFSPLKGSIQIDGFSLYRDSDTLFSCDRLYLKVFAPALLLRTVRVDSLLVDRPRINYRVDSLGVTSLHNILGIEDAEESDSKGSFVPHIILRSVQISQAAVAYDDLLNNINLNIGSLNSKLYYASRFMDADLTLAITDIKFKDRAVDLKLNEIDLSAVMVEGSIYDLLFSAAIDRDKLILRGDILSVKDISTLYLDLSTDLKISSSLLKSIQKDLEIDGGVIDLSGVASGYLSRPYLSLTSSYSGGVVYGLPIDNAYVSARLENMSLAVDSLSLSYDKTALLRGRSSFDLNHIFPDGLLFPLDESRLETVKWSSSIWIDEAPTFSNQSLLSFSLLGKLSGAGVIPETMNLDADIDAGAEAHHSNQIIESKISCRANLSGGRISLRDLVLIESLDTLISASLSTDIRLDSIEAKFKSSAIDLRRVTPYLGGLPLAGTLHIEGDVSGSMAIPSAEISLDIYGGRYDRFNFGNISFHTIFEGVEGKVDFDFNQVWGLNRFDISGVLFPFTPGTFDLLDEPFTNTILSGGINLADYTDSLLQGSLSIDGSYTGVGALGDGALFIDASKLKTPWIDIPKLYSPVMIKSGNFIVDGAEIELPGSGRVALDGRFDNLKDLDFRLSANNLIFDSLPYLPEYNISGEAELISHIGGSVDSLDVDFNILISDLSYETYKIPRDIRVDGRFSEDLLELNVSGPFEATASYSLDGHYALAAEISEYPLDSLFAYLGVSDFSGGLSAKLAISGYEDSIDSISAIFNNTWIGDSLGALVALRGSTLLYRDTSVELLNTRIFLPEGYSVLLDGIYHDDGVVDISLNGSFPLSLAERFTDEIYNSKGDIGLSLSVKGSPDSPHVVGDVFFSELSTFISSTGQRIHGLAGNIAFLGNRQIQPVIEGAIEREGSFLISGDLLYDSLKLSRGRVDILADRVPITVPDMMDMRINSDISYILQGERQRLTGSVELLDGYYYQNISLLPSAERRRRRTRGTHVDRNPLNLDISIISRGNFFVDNNLAFLELSPNLRVGGTDISPSLEGRTRVESGELLYLNRSFPVNQGQIDFINPDRVEMELDIQGGTLIGKDSIKVTLRGNPEDQLEFILEGSDANGGAISDEDVLSLLLMGVRASEMSEAGDIFWLQQLAYMVNSIDRPYKVVDRISLSFDDEGEPTIRIGEDLSRRLSTEVTIGFTSSKDPDAKSSQRVDLILQLFDNLRLRSFTDSEGRTGGEVELRLQRR